MLWLAASGASVAARMLQPGVAHSGFEFLVFAVAFPFLGLGLSTRSIARSLDQPEEDSTFIPFGALARAVGAYLLGLVCVLLPVGLFDAFRPS